MADEVGKENQVNQDNTEKTKESNTNDMGRTNPDGGRSMINTLRNPNFVPPDLYLNASDISPETGLPREAGHIISNNLEPINANDIRKKRLENYEMFDNQNGSLDFTHNLDKDIIPTPNTDSLGRVNYANFNDIYLGGYFGTSSDNEDPVMFGYDIQIDMLRSPLFNGDIDNFLLDETYAQIDEIRTRKEILDKFKNQFFKFFKVNTDTDTDVPNSKAHYIKKISGLDRLINDVDSETFKGQFVDYSKEFLTISLYEDVSLNLGYLASLYNALAWSRINGKRMIPENLLRFDLILTITEIRKFERVFKESDISYSDIADNVSKHVYNLYECQFFFNKAYHKSDIDLWSAPTTDNEISIKMNYKYFTHKFRRFVYDPENRNLDAQISTINNKNLDPTIVSDIDGEYQEQRIRPGSELDDPTQGSLADMVIRPPEKVSYKVIESHKSGSDNLTDADLAEAVASGEISAMEAIKIQEKRKNSKFRTLFNQTVNDLIGAGQRELHRVINSRVKLINDAIDRLLWSNIPGGMGISEPTNVYSDQSQFESDIKNALGNFVGGSIRNLLGK